MRTTSECITVYLNHAGSQCNETEIEMIKADRLPAFQQANENFLQRFNQEIIKARLSYSLSLSDIMRMMRIMISTTTDFPFLLKQIEIISVVFCGAFRCW